MYTEFAAQENTNRIVRAYMFLDTEGANGTYFAPAINNTGFVISVKSNVKICGLVREFIPPKVSIKGAFEFPYFYSYIDKKITSFAADFTPIGMYELTGKPGHTFLNNFVDAQTFLSKNETEELYRQLSLDISIKERAGFLENFIHEKTPQIINERSLLVERADDLAKKHDYKLSVKDIASKLGISEKTLGRAFTEVIGLSPKHYFSGNLFQEIIRRCNIYKQTEITDLLDSPFYDFSHINKWFKKFTSVSPQVFSHYDMHSVGHALAQVSTYQKE